MAGTNQGIIDPPIDSLLEKVDSKYQLVIYASKRARQINDYYSDLHEGNLFDNVGPLVDSTVEDKPLTIALHEIHEELRGRGVALFFAGVKGPVRDMMDRSGLCEQVGRDHFALTIHEAVLAAEVASPDEITKREPPPPKPSSSTANSPLGTEPDEPDEPNFERPGAAIAT